jgi:hypothetical protein
VLERERVLFIGTQFSILYTSMYSPAEAATAFDGIEQCKVELLHNDPQACDVVAVFASNTAVALYDVSSIDMYNNDVGQESAQKFMK